MWAYRLWKAICVASLRCSSSSRCGVRTYASLPDSSRLALLASRVPSPFFKSAVSTLRQITNRQLPDILRAGNGIEPATLSLEGSTLCQLSYSRASGRPAALASLLFAPVLSWWRGEVSNLRRHKPTDLQSVPFGHSGTSPRASRISLVPVLPTTARGHLHSGADERNSNLQPTDYKSVALPIELHRPVQVQKSAPLHP